jgi:hypothetical protein
MLQGDVLIISQILQCMQAREPLPDFILEFMDDDELVQRDFEPPLIKLLIRSCRLLSDHKSAGAMNEALATEAQMLMDDWVTWRPLIGAWGPNDKPSTKSVRDKADSDEVFYTIWLAVAYLFQQSTQILISDLQIEWTRSQHNILPGPETSAALEVALDTQIALCNTMRESILYYMKDFMACKATSRTQGAYMLLWPASIMLSITTTTPENFFWSAKQIAKVAEVFGLRQAQVVADILWMGVRAAPQYMPSSVSSTGDDNGK